jgi:type II secretory pathway pseudopilin PulG
MGFFGDSAKRASVSPTLREERAKDGAPASVVGLRAFVFGPGKADSKRRRKGRGPGSGDAGYILLAVLFLVVMVLIALALAAPKVAADIERDREVELMHRGLQYRRAIQLYYRKFGAYPPNMDVLEKVNQIRFLRKRYRDPVTGKDEWHLIHFGENKAPTTMGFFGQPLGGTGIGGTGCGGQSVGSVTTSTFGSSGSFGGSSSSGSSSGSGSFGSGSFGGSSSFGSSGTGTSSAGTTGCGTPDSGTASGLSGSPAGSGSSSLTDPNAGNSGGANSANSNGANSNGTNGNTSNGTDGSSTTAGGGTTSTNGAGTASTSGGSTLGGNGQTFGGGGIIGVESTSPKATILVYKTKKHFNEWEFVYDPISERMTVSSSLGAVGQPMSGVGNSNSPSPSLNNQPPGSLPPQGPAYSPNGNLPGAGQNGTPPQ